MTDMPQKLEIGPVKTGPVAPDFVTVDCVPGAHYRARWGTDPLPFPSDSVAEVYASHVLEHILWTKRLAALREVLRILVPGGLLEVWVPDFAVIARAYATQSCGDAWRKANPDGDYMTWVNGRVFTYGPGEENIHRTVYDARYLGLTLRQAGFVNIERIPKRLRGTSHGIIDLGMRARKATT